MDEILACVSATALDRCQQALHSPLDRISTMLGMQSTMYGEKVCVSLQQIEFMLSQQNNCDTECLAWWCGSMPFRRPRTEGLYYFSQPCNPLGGFFVFWRCVISTSQSGSLNWLQHSDIGCSVTQSWASAIVTKAVASVSQLFSWSQLESSTHFMSSFIPLNSNTVGMTNQLLCIPLVLLPILFVNNVPVPASNGPHHPSSQRDSCNDCMQLCVAAMRSAATSGHLFAHAQSTTSTAGSNDDGSCMKLYSMLIFIGTRTEQVDTKWFLNLMQYITTVRPNVNEAHTDENKTTARRGEQWQMNKRMKIDPTDSMSLREHATVVRGFSKLPVAKHSINERYIINTYDNIFWNAQISQTNHRKGFATTSWTHNPSMFCQFSMRDPDRADTDFVEIRNLISYHCDYSSSPSHEQTRQRLVSVGYVSDLLTTDEAIDSVCVRPPPPPLRSSGFMAWATDFHCLQERVALVPTLGAFCHRGLRIRCHMGPVIDCATRGYVTTVSTVYGGAAFATNPISALQNVATLHKCSQDKVSARIEHGFFKTTSPRSWLEYAWPYLTKYSPSTCRNEVHSLSSGSTPFQVSSGVGVLRQLSTHRVADGHCDLLSIRGTHYVMEIWDPATLTYYCLDSLTNVNHDVQFHSTNSAHLQALCNDYNLGGQCASTALDAAVQHRLGPTFTSLWHAFLLKHTTPFARMHADSDDVLYEPRADASHHKTPDSYRFVHRYLQFGCPSLITALRSRSDSADNTFEWHDKAHQHGCLLLDELSRWVSVARSVTMQRWLQFKNQSLYTTNNIWHPECRYHASTSSPSSACANNAHSTSVHQSRNHCSISAVNPITDSEEVPHSDRHIEQEEFKGQDTSWIVSIESYWFTTSVHALQGKPNVCHSVLCDPGMKKATFHSIALTEIDDVRSFPSFSPVELSMHLPADIVYSIADEVNAHQSFIFGHARFVAWLYCAAVHCIHNALLHCC
jgi:hypothetical protein